jgi:L-ascorbate metabolism protein UlaG (beta-lactamase superfamily)
VGDAEQHGVKTVSRLNIGGSLSIGELELTVVQAVHSASKGTPAVVIIKGESLTIYHAGDTALFGAIKIIGDH